MIGYVHGVVGWPIAQHARRLARDARRLAGVLLLLAAIVIFLWDFFVVARS